MAETRQVIHSWTYWQNAAGVWVPVTAATPLPVTSAAVSIESGIATGGTNVTLIDTTKDWAVNMFEDAYIEVTIGGVEYHRMITGNTNDTLTFNALPGGVVVALGDDYSITRETNPLTPVARAEVHNVAVAAGGNILGAALAPLNSPCTFRVTAGFSLAGILSVTLIRGGVPMPQHFNHGVVLTADCLFQFDVVLHAGDTANFTYSVACQIQTFRLDEIAAAVW